VPVARPLEDVSLRESIASSLVVRRLLSYEAALAAVAIVVDAILDDGPAYVVFNAVRHANPGVDVARVVDVITTRLGRSIC
jgi:hypothetical protein